MSLNPEIQKKAQAELDAVVGPNRLPYHADKDSLPYISAITKEALRWQNVAPFSIPHYTSEDLEYRGWFIPKGTVLVPNTWYENSRRRFKSMLTSTQGGHARRNGVSRS